MRAADLSVMVFLRGFGFFLRLLFVRRFGVLEEAVEIGVGLTVNPEAHVEAIEADFRQLLSEHFHVPRRFIGLVIDDP